MATCDGGQRAAQTVAGDGDPRSRVLIGQLLDLVVRPAGDRVVGVEEPLVDLAVAAPGGSLVVHQLEVHVLDPVEVVVSSPPGNHDRVGRHVVPHEPLDLRGGILDDCHLREVLRGLAEGAAPAFNLRIGAVRDHRVLCLQNSLLFDVGRHGSDDEKEDHFLLH
jgi:hypothetical protein